MREMKDSGVEWIGEIPTTWELSKIGSIYDERNEKVSDKDYEPLSVTKQGIVPQLETAAKTDNGDNRKLIKKNDFVINSRSDRRGSCGISEYDGSCSLINTVLRPRRNMCNKYYGFVFKSENFADEYYRWGHGIVNDLWSTKWSDMKNIYIPMPSIEEQKKMAEYLDSKCSKIDAIIEKQQTIIEKLKEYKLSVITEAVTKGLNSDVDMVTCDAEWISEMPVNWMTAPIKKVTEFITCGVAATPEYTDESNGFLFLSAQNVKDGKMDYTVKRYIVPELHESLTKKRKPRRGDIVQVRVGATIGNVAVVDTDEPYSVYVSLTHMRTNEMVTSEFFKYALSNSMFQQKAMSFVDFAGSQGNLNVADMKKLKILVPPIEEQKNISDYLTKNCNSIDEMLNKKNKIVEKLQEYKKSLIYEVVTGKKEV